MLTPQSQRKAAGGFHPPKALLDELPLPLTHLMAGVSWRPRIDAVSAAHGLRFQEKWRLALTLLHQARASGLTVTACSAMRS
jgi:hypothetical protein